MALSKTDEQIIQLFESGAVRTKLAAVRYFKPKLSRSDAQAYATQLWKTAEVIERAAFLHDSATQDAEMVLGGMRFHWRAIAEGIESMLVESGVCEVIQVPDRNNVLFEVRCVLLPGVTIPEQALPFIKRVELVTAQSIDGSLEQRRAIVAHKYADKERLRASELLTKSYGQLIDRQEVTGANGGPLETITAEMDPIKAAEIYRNATKY